MVVLGPRGRSGKPDLLGLLLAVPVAKLLESERHAGELRVLPALQFFIGGQEVFVGNFRKHRRFLRLRPLLLGRPAQKRSGDPSAGVVRSAFVAATTHGLATGKGNQVVKIRVGRTFCGGHQLHIAEPTLARLVRVRVRGVVGVDVARRKMEKTNLKKLKQCNMLASTDVCILHYRPLRRQIFGLLGNRCRENM